MVHSHLAATTEVTNIVGSRIYSRLPPNAIYPLVRVFRRGGAFRDVDHIDQGILQVELWGAEDREQLDLLTRVVRTALTFDEIVGVHTLGVVTNSEELAGPIFRSDPPTGRDRYLFDVQIDTHP